MLFAKKLAAKSACFGPGVWYGFACIGVGYAFNDWITL